MNPDPKQFTLPKGTIEYIFILNLYSLSFFIDVLYFFSHIYLRMQKNVLVAFPDSVTLQHSYAFVNLLLQVTPGIVHRKTHLKSGIVSNSASDRVRYRTLFLQTSFMIVGSVGIRDILLRIRIRGSASLDPYLDPTPVFSDFKDAKKVNFSILLSCNLPTSTLSSVF